MFTSVRTTHTHGAGHLGAAVQVSKSQTSSAEAGGKAGEEAKVAERGQGQRGLSGNSLSPSTPHVSKKKKINHDPSPPSPQAQSVFLLLVSLTAGGLFINPLSPPFSFLYSAFYSLSLGGFHHSGLLLSLILTLFLKFKISLLIWL